jgi:hypothetical protein
VWSEGGPNGEVKVRQVVAANPVAYQEIWRFLLDIDLTRSVGLWSGAADEPLFDLVNEPRRLGARIGDGLWLRVVDVAAALEQRRYGAPIDLVLEVADPLLPENTGRYRLTGLRDGAHRAPSSDRPTRRWTSARSGSLYLGALGRAPPTRAAFRSCTSRSGRRMPPRLAQSARGDRHVLVR